MKVMNQNMFQPPFVPVGIAETQPKYLEITENILLDNTSIIHPKKESQHTRNFEDFLMGKST